MTQNIDDKYFNGISGFAKAESFLNISENFNVKRLSVFPNTFFNKNKLIENAFLVFNFANSVLLWILKMERF